MGFALIPRILSLKAKNKLFFLFNAIFYESVDFSLYVASLTDFTKIFFVFSLRSSCFCLECGIKGTVDVPLVSLRNKNEQASSE